MSQLNEPADTVSRARTVRAIAQLSIRHKWVVAAVWLALAVMGAAMASTTITRLTYDDSTPGQPGYDATVHITQHFGVDARFEPTIAVLHLPAELTMHDGTGRAAASRAFAAAARPSVVAVADYANTADPALVSADGRTTWAILTLANPDIGAGVGAGDDLQAPIQAAAPPGATVAVTGFAQLLAAGGGGGGPSILVETATGGALALLVLFLVYGSAIAIIPLLTAVPAILVTFLGIFGLTHVIGVSYFLQYLTPLFGLGVAVDYSLLIVARWRAGRDRGLSNDDAVLGAAGRAGGAVLLSGVTVGVGLLSLVLLPVPFLRGIGIGAMLIPLVAVAAAVTLLPVILSVAGPTLDRRRIHHGGSEHSRRWERWGRLIVRRRWTAGIAGLTIVVVAALPALSLNTAEPDIGSLSKASAPARTFQGLQAAGVPAAVDFPIYVLTEGGSAGRAEATRIAEACRGFTRCSPRTPTPSSTGPRR